MNEVASETTREPGLNTKITGPRFSDVSVQVFVMLGLLIVLVLGTWQFDENFFSPITVKGLLRDSSILALFALGQAIVIISGGIDLSVGSFLCFSGVSTIMIMNSHDGIGFAGAAVLVVGMAIVIGLIHGLLVCLLDLQPFLVTLCSLLVFRGLSRALTGDSVQTFNPEKYPLIDHLGGGSAFGIPMPVYVLIAVLIPLSFFMYCTVPGRYLFAIGSNREAARFSGVPVHRLRIVGFVISAVLASLAGFLEAGSVGSVTPSTAGIAYEMYGITAAVLGGCALRGGQGSLLGVVIGAAILRVLRTAVIFFDISTYWTFAVTGLVLLSAVVVDALVRQRRGRTS